VTWRLRSRLTLSYLLVAALCVLMVSLLANLVLETAFRRYLANTREHDARQVAARLGPLADTGGSWDMAAVEAVGMAALEQGMIVKVADGAGRVVWDATVHNNGLCTETLTHMAQNTTSRYPSWHGSYAETRYPVSAGAQEVGFVAVGYYGPFYLDDQQLAFITMLNRMLGWVSLAAMAIAVAMGLLSARRIAIPLGRFAEATRRIAEGRRDVRITQRTRIRELDEISGSVNDLARTLGEQEALRRRLTADMAHELRTPLATLQSHLEALIDGVWEPDPARLAGLHEETLRITRLMTELESLARVEGDSASLRKVPTDLSALVGGIVRNHELPFDRKGVGLRFAAGPGVEGASISVDPDRLSQAVINLLANALEFTPSGGSVEVRVTATGTGYEIAVRDTGIGISAEDLPRIFERFYRVDASRSRETGGTGIGLAIARAIVEAHGGTISAESEPGRGSTFRITLCRGTSPESA
jgi:two-component system sensor histidine kinase BaeS